MKRLICLFVLSFLINCMFVPLYAQESDVTTVFLVRHAEKENDGSADPVLTLAGRERALELAYILKDVKLNAVYDTPYKRTQQTAKPTADNHGLKAETISSLRADDLKTFVNNVLKKHKGGSILIVSHSNIVPVIIKLIHRDEFDAREVEYINDSVYDDLFVVSFTKRETARVLNLKYGKHTPIK
ncbi:phosphoglycerate mutase family protein [candidate division KSB1 bacterium]